MTRSAAHWIAVCTDVTRHYKTLALKRALGVSRIEALGLLTNLWLWCFQYAETGVLSRQQFDAWLADIAEDVSVDLVEDALTKAGWLDRDGDGFRVHEWDLYQERWIKGRVRERERSRRRRQEAKAGHNGDGQGEGVPDPSAGRPADDRRSTVGTGQNKRVDDRKGDHRREHGAEDAFTLGSASASEASCPVAQCRPGELGLEAAVAAAFGQSGLEDLGLPRSSDVGRTLGRACKRICELAKHTAGAVTCDERRPICEAALGAALDTLSSAAPDNPRAFLTRMTQGDPASLVGEHAYQAFSDLNKTVRLPAKVSSLVKIKRIDGDDTHQARHGTLPLI